MVTQGRWGLRCTVYTVQWTVFSVQSQCTVNSVHCNTQTKHSSLYVHCTFYSLHCTVYSTEYTMYSRQCAAMFWEPVSRTHQFTQLYSRNSYISITNHIYNSLWMAELVIGQSVETQSSWADLFHEYLNICANLRYCCSLSACEYLCGSVMT